MTKSPAAFIDLPIEGERNFSSEQEKEQYPREQFAEVLRDALAFDELLAIRWRQYTPYFNDGEPCIFHSWGAIFKFASVSEEAGEDGDGFVEAYDDVYRERIGTWDYEGNWPERRRVITSSPNPALAEAVWAVERAIDDGHHNATLLELFGDHAQVTCDGKRFEIEYYEHE